MTKTPLQELIEQLEKEHKRFLEEDDVPNWFYKNGIKQAIKYAEAMLEKEKETMVDFAYKCRNVMAADEFAISHWYDKTFNTKEK